MGASVSPSRWQTGWCSLGRSAGWSEAVARHAPAPPKKNINTHAVTGPDTAASLFRSTVLLENNTHCWLAAKVAAALGRWLNHDKLATQVVRHIVWLNMWFCASYSHLRPTTSRVLRSLDGLREWEWDVVSVYVHSPLGSISCSCCGSLQEVVTDTEAAHTSPEENLTHTHTHTNCLVFISYSIKWQHIWG